MKITEIEFDITWNGREGSHMVMVDTGEETIYLDRQQLMDMLEALREADESL